MQIFLLLLYRLDSPLSSRPPQTVFRPIMENQDSSWRSGAFDRGCSEVPIFTRHCSNESRSQGDERRSADPCDAAVAGWRATGETSCPSSHAGHVIGGGSYQADAECVSLPRTESSWCPLMNSVSSIVFSPLLPDTVINQGEMAVSGHRRSRAPCFLQFQSIV